MVVSYKLYSLRERVKKQIVWSKLENMANSKYEYVKSFELEDEVMLPNLMLVRIDGRDFTR